MAKRRRRAAARPVGRRLTSIIGFEELLRTSNAINNATFEPFTVYGLVALIFFLLCFPLTQYARMLERRTAPH